MNWSDLEAVWKRQKLPPAEPVNVTELSHTFEAKRRQLARRLFWRDVTEGAAGVVVATFLTTSTLRRGIAYWPNGIAILLIVAVTVFFIRERIRARRMHVPTDAPLLTKLDADIMELKRQRWLLLNVGKWYVAPLMASVLIVVTTTAINHLNKFQSWRIRIAFGAYLIFCAVLAWRVSERNKRAAQKKIEPRIAELEQLRDNLLSSR